MPATLSTNRKGDLMTKCKVLIVAGILLFACSAALADTVYFSPADSYRSLGSSFEIDIRADISPNPGLTAFGFNLTWNPSLMGLINVTGDGSDFDILWDSGTPESIIGFLLPTPSSPPSASGSNVLLANLYFKCLGEGSSTLGIAMDAELVAIGLQGFYGPVPDPSDPLAGPGPLLGFDVTPGSVDQGTVPEPGSIVLLSSALLGLAIWSRRK
jgi:hypothetical protein